MIFLDLLPTDTDMFEIKINKSNTMLLPSKNVDKLFEELEDEEDN